MTAKEAMRIRENATAEDVDNKELHKCIDEALEKQIPKKPNVYGDGYDDLGNMIYDTYDCPNCDTSFELDYEEYDYCPSCGQKFDWSDKNNDRFLYKTETSFHHV